MSTSQSFSELGLPASILQTINEIGYETPSAIQSASIPPLLEGRDLLGQAQTGTGKTAAFALPLLSRIDPRIRAPQMLVLTPTRELAIQVAEALQVYARHLTDFHVLPVYGGQSMSIQLRQLKRGVHVIVGTPGRIQDHLRRKTLMLDQIRSVVLDEADEMLRMGFVEEVESILEHAPAERQVALFSATMPDAVRKVTRRHLRNPVEIKIETKTSTVESINQRYWQVSGVHKLDALTRILEAENGDAMIIFVRTKTATVELAEKLEARGYSSSPLNGDMNQAVREKTIERLKNGNLDIVVATDVAARGLDVERISHVLNYDIPTDTEAYVHRIGRTGRAGRKGEAILFVAPREMRMLRAIERATRQTITPMKLPSHTAVADKRVGQFKDTLTETLEAQDLSFFEEMIAQYQQEHDIGLSEIAAALAFLVQRERPLAPPTAEQLREDSRPERHHVEDDRPARRRDRDFSRDRNDRGGDRGDRGGDRGDRGGERSGRREDHHREAESGMETYRIEVGRDHGIQPKHIVGAIANEAEIESRHIGHIKLYDTYSTVDLPEGMPAETFQHLRRVRVCGHPMNIHKDGTAPPPPTSSARRGPPPGAGAKKKPRRRD